MKKPRVSICIPIHDVKNGDFFLSRLINSIVSQNYRNIEIIITKQGKMAENTNAAIKRATGELIKIMYMDDYFYHISSLRTMVNNFREGWMMVGADNNPMPEWTDNLIMGNNRLGSPSALMFENDSPILFDEKFNQNNGMEWLLDCDLYYQLHKRYGKPTICNGVYIGIGIHEGQMTNILTEQDKLKEHEYLAQKYA